MFFSNFVVLEYLHFNHGENKGSNLDKKIIEFKGVESLFQNVSILTQWFVENNSKTKVADLNSLKWSLTKLERDCWL